MAHKWTIGELKLNFSPDDLKDVTYYMTQEYLAERNQETVVKAANAMVERGREWARAIVDEDLPLGESYIGNVTNINPDGAYGLSAVNELFWEGADEVLSAANLDHYQGDGDGLDLFIYRS